jgi:2'-5' RNA ligase
MTQYAIVAFPSSEALPAIEAVRRRFDPLAAVLPAHVTLVFPFASTMSPGILQAHVEAAVSNQPALALSFARPTAADGEYVFLHLTLGAPEVVALHDRLYSGPLAGHLSMAERYTPHVTVARAMDEAGRRAAMTQVNTTLPPLMEGRIDAVAVFRLTGVTSGDVMFTVPLGETDGLHPHSHVVGPVA